MPAMIAGSSFAAARPGVPRIRDPVSLAAETAMESRDEAWGRAAVERLLSPRVPKELGAWEAQAAAATGFDATARLGGVGCPALVLAGDEDVLVPLSAALELAEGILGAVLEVLHDTGHDGVAEEPETSCRRIAAFARDAEATAS